MHVHVHIIERLPKGKLRSKSHSGASMFPVVLTSTLTLNIWFFFFTFARPDDISLFNVLVPVFGSFYCFIFFKKRIFFVFERQRDRGKFCPLVHCSHATIAWSRKSWVSSSQVLEPLSSLAGCVFTEAGIRNAARTRTRDAVSQAATLPLLIFPLTWHQSVCNRY